jgi:hypothetical protein
LPRFYRAVLTAAALIAPIAVTPGVMFAQDHDDHHNDRTYHDKAHNDDHHWDDHEDKAYRIWAQQNHRKYKDFAKLREQDQQAYWGWRHDHPDAVLNINIP